MKLSDQKSRPIPAGAAPLTRQAAQELVREIPGWTLEENSISREYRFKDFGQAMEFANRAAAIINEQDHHPDMFISYSKVRLTFTTHKIGGLSMNDFIVAAKIDAPADEQGSVKAA